MMNETDTKPNPQGILVPISRSKISKEARRKIREFEAMYKSTHEQIRERAADGALYVKSGK